jgi:DNA-binding transcriptional LysR family regulator
MIRWRYSVLHDWRRLKSLEEVMVLTAQFDFTHLRYFIAAADYGSFRKAAAALEVQVSTVSRRVRDLEDCLGASLFQRHNGGVLPTVAGQKFVPYARRALRQIGQGTKAVAAIGRSEDGRINIGIFSSLASGFLASLFRRYCKEHPRVRLEYVDGDPVEHVSAVRQLRLDVAFITGTSAWTDCEIEQLWFERVFAVLPSDHPLCSKQEVGWNDLASEQFIVSDAAPGPEIHDYLVQRLADLGHHPEIRAQYVGRDNLLSLVAIGQGLTLTSEATIVAQFPAVSYRPVANEILPFCAVWSPRNDNPAFRSLLSLARSMTSVSRPGGLRLPSSSPAQSALPSQTPDP